MQRILPLRAVVLAVFVLVSCSESGTRGPTAPTPPPTPLLPLAASIAPAADTIETDQTTQFTLEITGGDPNAEPAWTCVSADSTVASASATTSGCSATGTGTGTTAIAATVTRGTAHGHRFRQPPGDPAAAHRLPRAGRRHRPDGPDRPVHPRDHRRRPQRRTGLDVRLG